MATSTLGHREVMQSIIDMLDTIDTDSLSDVFSIVTGQELIYIGGDEFEIYSDIEDCDDNEYDWDINKDKDY